MSMISEHIDELRLMAKMFDNGDPYGNLLRRAANTIEMLSEENCIWRKEMYDVYICTGDACPCTKHINDGLCPTLKELFRREVEE